MASTTLIWPLGDLASLLDLGAKIGLAPIYLARRLRPERIGCVEPSEANFALLSINLGATFPRRSQ